MITTSTVPLKGKLKVPRTSIISRIEAWVEFQDVRVEYWDLRFETLEVRKQRSSRAITFSNDLKFFTFSLNHGLKIRIVCIVSDRAKLCSKYNTCVVLWLLFCCVLDPLRYLERNLARNSIVFLIFLDNNHVDIIIYTVCVTLFVISRLIVIIYHDVEESLYYSAMSEISFLYTSPVSSSNTVFRFPSFTLWSMTLELDANLTLSKNIGLCLFSTRDCDKTMASSQLATFLGHTLLNDFWSP